MLKFWTWLRSNKYFVAGSSVFMTYVATALYNWVEAGTPALSLAQLKATALAALGVVVVAEYHLYTNTPEQAAKLAAGQPAGPK
jgi:hypothetical protein